MFSETIISDSSIRLPQKNPSVNTFLQFFQQSKNQKQIYLLSLSGNFRALILKKRAPRKRCKVLFKTLHLSHNASYAICVFNSWNPFSNFSTLTSRRFILISFPRKRCKVLFKTLHLSHNASYAICVFNSWNPFSNFSTLTSRRFILISFSASHLET